MVTLHVVVRRSLRRRGRRERDSPLKAAERGLGLLGAPRDTVEWMVAF